LDGSFPDWALKVAELDPEGTEIEAGTVRAAELLFSEMF
jgi:hypothetical protein